MTVAYQAISSEGQSGWCAELELGYTARPTKTVLSNRKQRGPLAIQRPFYPEGNVCHTYVLHPPGGVVGGDHLSISVDVASGAHSLLTTPGATKFYRSEGKQAYQKQTFNIADGVMEWLPQENIFFPSAIAKLETEIHLNEESNYIGWEIQCLGRPVIGETFDQGKVEFVTRLYRSGIPTFIDRLQVAKSEDLLGAASLKGCPVNATMLATTATSQTLSLAQAVLAESDKFAEQNNSSPMGYSGVTLMNDVLIVRYLGHSTAEAHRLFRSVWHAIRPDILSIQPTPPRIWNT